MTKEDVLEFAQKSIYSSVDYLGKWNGYQVWEPGFNDNEEHCVGFPSFILVIGNIIRWDKGWEESSKIMDYFNKKG